MFDNSRRGFVKKAMYVAPAVLTLGAAPEFAKAGSIKDDEGLEGRGHQGPEGRGPQGPQGLKGKS